LEWINWGFLVVVALVALFLIWALIRVIIVLGTTNTLLKSLEAEINPLLRNLRETSENLNRVLRQTQDKISQLDALFMTLKESAQTVGTINRVLRGGVTTTLLNMAGLAAGFKTAGQTFFKSIGKGGSEHGRRK
jgi:uncharacterized protein YoxC